MNKFIQRIPGGVDIRPDERLEFDFETTEFLVNHEFVQRFVKIKEDSELVLSGNHLMVISDEGFHWWVIGSLDSTEDVNLPEWNGWKMKVKYDDGSEEILYGSAIQSICGDEVMLSDGRKAKRI